MKYSDFLMKKKQLSHILLQYVRFCMSNINQKSVLVICPQGQYRHFPQNQLPVSAQWSQRLYVKVQGKMVQKYMQKIVFQSN